MQNSTKLQEWFGGIDIYLFDQLLKGRITPEMKVLDAGCGSGRNLVYFLRSGYEVFAVDESEEAIAQTRRLAGVLAPHLPAENFRVEAVERMSWETVNSRQDSANSRQQTIDSQAVQRGGQWSVIGGQLNQKTDKSHPPATVGGTDRAADSNRETSISSQHSANSQTQTDSGFDVVLSSAVLHFARDEGQWQAMVNEMWRVLKPGGIFFARLASTIGIENQVRLLEGRRYHLPDGSDRFLVDEAMLRQVTAALGGEFIEPIKTTVVENLRAMTTWVVRKGNS